VTELRLRLLDDGTVVLIGADAPEFAAWQDRHQKLLHVALVQKPPNGQRVTLSAEITNDPMYEIADPHV
jgi:hypothetical protein